MLAALIVVWVGGLLAAPPRPSSWLVLLSGLPVLALISARQARREGRPWAAHLRATPDVHALGLVLLYALGVLMADSHGISTDGVTYFAQLRSVIFDRDLDVAAEFAYLGQPPRPNYVVPIGPVLLWLPLYLAVAAVDTLGRGLGLWSAPADATTIGLGLPYVRAALISSFAIGAAGLFAVLWHLRRSFGPTVAFIATVLVFGATPLYWYMVYEPSMTHAASFGFVALFIVLSAHWLQPGAVGSPSHDAPDRSASPFPTRRQSLFSVPSSGSRSSRDRRSRSSPSSRGCSCSPRPACRQRTASAGRSAWRAGRCWERCRGSCCSSDTATSSSRVTSTTCSGRRGIQSAALALDRHAVLLVARIPVVDAGGLPRCHWHLRLPAA